MLEAIAWTADDIIMAVRHRTNPVWGVQFHPESICTEMGAELVANFLALSHGEHLLTTPLGMAAPAAECTQEAR